MDGLAPLFRTLVLVVDDLVTLEPKLDFGFGFECALMACVEVALL